MKSLVNTYYNLTKYYDKYEYNTINKKISYSCPKEKIININSNKKHISFSIDSEKKSFENKKKSSFVNIIHSLDSELCINTRIDLLNKYNIKSKSIHDCFIIHINHYEKCLECYNDNLYKIYNFNINKIIPIKNKLEYINDYKLFINNKEYLKDIIKYLNKNKIYNKNITINNIKNLNNINNILYK